MSNIEVGEYVRTKKGYISKVTDIDQYIWFDKKINKESGMAVYELSRIEFKNLVTKHSKNIIDLIEEGNYVNGKRVIEADNLKGAIREIYVEGQNPEKDCGLYFEQIETIVTKENFKEMEYRV